MNPANQLGSGWIVFSTIGLSTGMTLGKLAFNYSERPLFIEAFIAIIFSSPS